jgi:DNA-directed RNA polymerase beta' subunit
MKCSFEETVNVLAEAALNSELDMLKGVTENIMLGKPTKIGTGATDIIVDNDKLRTLQHMKTQEDLKRNEAIIKYRIVERSYKRNANSFFRPSSPIRE